MFRISRMKTEWSQWMSDSNKLIRMILLTACRFRRVVLCERGYRVCALKVGGAYRTNVGQRLKVLYWEWMKAVFDFDREVTLLPSQRLGRVIFGTHTMNWRREAIETELEKSDPRKLFESSRHLFALCDILSYSNDSNNYSNNAQPYYFHKTLIKMADPELVGLIP